MLFTKNAVYRLYTTNLVVNTRTRYVSTRIHVGAKIVESRGLHTTMFFSRVVENISRFFFRISMVEKSFLSNQKVSKITTGKKRKFTMISIATTS